MKYYLIEDVGGGTAMYTWLTAPEILKELHKITKTKYKVTNEKQWQKAMAKYMGHWHILDSDETM